MDDPNVGYTTTTVGEGEDSGSEQAPVESADMGPQQHLALVTQEDGTQQQVIDFGRVTGRGGAKDLWRVLSSVCSSCRTAGQHLGGGPASHRRHHHHGDAGRYDHHHPCPRTGRAGRSLRHHGYGRRLGRTGRSERQDHPSKKVLKTSNRKVILMKTKLQWSSNFEKRCTTRGQPSSKPLHS